MHLEESEWTLRCGNRVSAYLLNHNCSVFSQKRFAYLNLLSTVAFLEGWRGAKGRHSDWKQGGSFVPKVHLLW